MVQRTWAVDGEAHLLHLRSMLRRHRAVDFRLYVLGDTHDRGRLVHN